MRNKVVNSVVLPTLLLVFLSGKNQMLQPKAFLRQNQQSQTASRRSHKLSGLMVPISKSNGDAFGIPRHGCRGAYNENHSWESVLLNLCSRERDKQCAPHFKSGFRNPAVCH